MAAPRSHGFHDLAQSALDIQIESLISSTPSSCTFEDFWKARYSVSPTAKRPTATTMTLMPS
jgi:hypothetical protein